MAITPDDIAVALGRPSPQLDSPEWAQWSMWIGDALMLIDARKTLLGVTIDLDAAKLDYVVREAVAAHVRRPDDATQVTVAIDDGSTSRTYRSSKGRLDILDEWWSLLGLNGARQAFSVDTAPTGTGEHSPWCSALTYTDASGAVVYGGAYCTCGADIAGQPIYEGDWY